MTLEEYYKECRRENEARKRNPVCINCKNYYKEYGMPCCSIHDMPLEHDATDKCFDWN